MAFMALEMAAGPAELHETLWGRPASEGARSEVSRVRTLFIREVNLAIGGMCAAVVILAGAHYVSLVHETRRIRQELCVVNLALLSARNPYLKLDPPPADPCATLSTLTGEQVTMPAATRGRTGA
jgi:hypothetical protein